jgi:hypothetical protein
VLRARKVSLPMQWRSLGDKTKSSDPDRSDALPENPLT